MAGLLRCFGAPRAVHNLGDPSTHPRLSWEKPGGGNDDCAGQGAGGSCEHGFGSLPNHLLERIFGHLEPSSRLTRYSVCGVSRSWRLVGRHLFFSSPWTEAQPICHPSQLFCLSPLPLTSSRSGLLKCFVRRERIGGGGGACFGGRRGAGRGLSRYCLYLGRDGRQQHRAHFLMCAVQVSRSELLIYLNRSGRGFPAARLCATNTICTRYTLGLAQGVRLLSQSRCEQGRPQVKYAPQEQGSVEYQAKLEGFMQPRRVEVRLTRPGELEFGQVLPTLCRQGGDLEASYHGGSSYLARSSYFTRGLAGKALPAWGSRADSARGACSGPAVAAAGAGAGAGAGTGAAGLGGAGSMSPQQQQQQQQQQHGEEGHGEVPFEGSSSTAGGGSGEVEGAPAGQHGGEGGLEGAPAQQAEQAQQAQQAQRAVVLRNKPPEWNADMRAWVLNFHGRVKKASVKNFQLIRDGDQSLRTVLQFGKVEKHLYIMDWDPTVVTAFQSFAISLSTFDGKFLL